MNIPAHAKYAIIQEMYEREDCLLNIKHLCEIAGVSRSGYYHYLATADVRDEREDQDRKDVQLIIDAYRHRGYDR